MDSALLRTIITVMISYWLSQQTVRAWSRPLVPASSSSSNLSFGSSCDSSVSTSNNNNNKFINLSTVTKEELQTLLTTAWGHPPYRADQVWNWIRVQGVTDVTQMKNLPQPLRQQLLQYTKPTSLTLVEEAVSAKDGTIKRAYRCVDGQVIESVLMPYDDGRYTACISSQAGCAQGCVFCATGQMGFSVCFYNNNTCF